MKSSFHHHGILQGNNNRKCNANNNSTIDLSPREATWKKSQQSVHDGLLTKTRALLQKFPVRKVANTNWSLGALCRQICKLFILR